MAEDLSIDLSASKADRYRSLLPQIEALMLGESDLTANLANVAAALKFGMDFFWVGFYRVDGDELVLSPFQGPVACTRITRGKGVCGTSWAENKTILVPDVDQFPGHIACSNDSKSEIVIPVRDANGNVALILDVDSAQLNDFDETDQQYLEALANLLEQKL